MRELICRLESEQSYINLVFHDILIGPSPDPFAIRTTYFDDLTRWLIKTGLSRWIRLYFDDNLASFYKHVLPVLSVQQFGGVSLAIPVTSIDRPGYGSSRDLQRASESSIHLLPHGYSHVALASYSGNSPLPTPLGGLYRDRDAKRDSPPSENEVLFQLIESSESYPFQSSTEFVLPYGAYNATVVAINQRLGIYRTLARAECHLEIDAGQELRPRLLVDARRMAQGFEDLLTVDTGCS